MGWTDHPLHYCGHCGEPIGRNHNNQRKRCAKCHEHGCTKCMNANREAGGFIHDNCGRIKSARILNYGCSIGDDECTAKVDIVYNAKQVSEKGRGDTADEAIQDSIEHSAKILEITPKELVLALSFDEKSEGILKAHKCNLQPLC